MLQHDLGPNLAVTDVGSRRWVSTGRMETKSSSGQRPCFCSGALSSQYLPNYPMKTTASHSLKNLFKDVLVKTE